MPSKAILVVNFVSRSLPYLTKFYSGLLCSGYNRMLLVIFCDIISMVLVYTWNINTGVSERK